MSALQNLLYQVANSLHRWHWVLLILIAPFLLFPSPTSVLALLVIPGLWIISLLAGNNPVPRTPLNLTLLLLSLMVLVSTGITYDMKASLPKIAGMVLGMGVFYAYVSYGQRARGLALCLFAFLVTGMGVALLGLLGTRWTIKVDWLLPFTYRFAPIITDLPGAEEGISPNQVAGALLWVLPLLVALCIGAFTWVRSRAAASRRWLFPSSLLLVEALLFIAFVFLLCQSRSAYLALAIACAVLLPIVLPRRWRWLFLGGLMVGGILIGTFTWKYGAGQLLHVTFGDKVATDPFLFLNTLGGRAKIWSRATVGIEKFPFGMGMNIFRYSANTLDPLDPTYLKDVPHAHNEFLQAALDLGIPGLIAFAALYIGAFWMLGQIWNKPGEDLGEEMPSPPESLLRSPFSARALAVGLGGGLLAHLLYGLTDAVTFGAKPGILFWMLLGLVVSLYQQRQVQVTH